jgi:HSP20 family protein
MGHNHTTNRGGKEMIYRTGTSTPVFGLRREIDRLFEDAFGRGDAMSTWSPAVDVRETEKELRLDIEIPGMRPDDIEITAENGVLTVQGEKKGERKEGEEGSRYHVIERSYGSFSRSFQLPQGLDDSKIEADCDNGILSIHIPKAALPQPKKIQIGRGAQKQVSQASAATDREVSKEPARSEPLAAGGKDRAASSERTTAQSR